uniref:Ig-like domain-containing protein n=1 Tax=Sparus aurata TaxID=8175 RepID=A0A671VX36_SPAAU
MKLSDLNSGSVLNVLISGRVLHSLRTLVKTPSLQVLPSVSVSPSAEIVEGSSVTLTCSSDANPAANYTWYKKNGDPDLHPLSKNPQLVFSSIQSSDSGEYYCTAENELGRRTSEYISIDVTCELPSVSVSPSGEIMEGSSVTLTCSSDANPAAKYTWYKEKQTLIQGPDGIYHFSSISSEDRGNYYCKSENQYGEINSPSLFIDVQYAPRLPSVSVSPSAEIVEGSSVTLTCSSDANPAANYTWYKKNGDPDLHPLSKEPQLVFSSIQSSDSGEYYCTAENELGRRTSKYISINVTNAPRLPSVSVSPSAEIVGGSSVNLTCSSDANPAANYTWYKENEDSPKASGQIFTITDFTAEHSGNYHCEAQNSRGRHNSTLQLIVEEGDSVGRACTSCIETAVVLGFNLTCGPLLHLIHHFVTLMNSSLTPKPYQSLHRLSTPTISYFNMHLSIVQMYARKNINLLLKSTMSYIICLFLCSDLLSSRQKSEVFTTPV